MTVVVKIHNGYFYAGKQALEVTGNTVIPARSAASYELVDKATGNAPKHINVQQRASDLLVSVDGDESADLVIQGFFRFDDSQLVGLSDDGHYYSYLPEQSEFSALFGEKLNPRTWYDKLFGDEAATVEKATGMQPLTLGRYGKVTPWLLDAKTEPMGDLLLPVLGSIGMSGLILLGIENAKKDNTGSIPTPPAPERPTAEINKTGTEVTGKAEAGSTVRVLGPSGELGTAKAANDGKYSVTLSEPQINAQQLRVTASKGGPASQAAPVTAPDKTAPEKAENVVINKEGTEVTGKAEAGATVKVLDEYDNVLGSAKVGRDGKFTVTLLVAQAAEQALKVRVDDAADNKSDTIAIKGAKGANGVVTSPVDIDKTANLVAEDAKKGDSVGITVKATDYEKVTYTMLDDAGGRFAIDKNTGVVVVAGALDYETATRHTIKVQAASADGSIRDASFTIGVKNINDNKVGALSDADSATNQVSSTAKAGDKVGITAKAVDADGDKVTYSLVNSADGKFSINADTGVVVVRTDVSKHAGGKLTIKVKATSADGSSNEKEFDINVLAAANKKMLFMSSEDTVFADDIAQVSTVQSELVQPSTAQLIATHAMTTDTLTPATTEQGVMPVL